MIIGSYNRCEYDEKYDLFFEDVIGTTIVYDGELNEIVTFDYKGSFRKSVEQFLEFYKQKQSEIKEYNPLKEFEK